MPTRRTVLAGLGTATVAAFGVGAVGADGGTDDGDESDGDGNGDGDGDGGDGDPQAALRLVHASPDAPRVDVAVDGTEVVSALGFRRASEYLTLAPGEHTVRVTEADGSTVFYDETLTLDAAAYTVVASGEATVDEPTFGVDVLTDTPVDLDDGEARLRAVHASPDAGAVDVTLDDAETVAVDDLTPGATASTTLAAGDYEAELRPDGDDDDAYGDDLPRLERVLTLAAGESYTALVLGYVTPEGEATSEGLGVVVLADRTEPPTADDEEEDEDDDEEGEDDEEEDDEDDEEEEEEDDEEDEDDEEGRGPPEEVPPGGRGPPESVPPDERGRGPPQGV